MIEGGLHTMYSYSLATLFQKHDVPAGPGIDWLTAVSALACRAADHSLWLRMPPGQAIERAERRQGHPYSGEQRVYLHHVDDAYLERAAADRDGDGHSRPPGSRVSGGCPRGGRIPRRPGRRSAGGRAARR